MDCTVKITVLLAIFPSIVVGQCLDPVTLGYEYRNGRYYKVIIDVDTFCPNVRVNLHFFVVV